MKNAATGNKSQALASLFCAAALLRTRATSQNCFSCLNQHISELTALVINQTMFSEGGQKCLLHFEEKTHFFIGFIVCRGKTIFSYPICIVFTLAQR